MVKRKRLSATVGSLILLLVTLLAVNGALAASSISFGSPSLVGDLGGLVQALVAGDLDKDGDPDLVSADGKINAWQNEGDPFTGPWATQYLGNPGTLAHSLAIGDLDNDGDLDIASGGAFFVGTEIKVWENDGTPFNDAWVSTDAGHVDTVYGLAAGDLDNDGDLDLVSADGGAEIYAWRNDGAPFSGTWPDQYVGAVGNDAYTVALGDLDNDGDLDIVVGSRDDEVIAFENDGTPFSAIWPSTTVAKSPDVADDVRNVALADLDGDGDLDVVAGVGSLQTYPVMAWLNPGHPFSSAWVPHEIGQTGEPVYALVAADWDLDGDPDVASGTDVSADTEIAAWDNAHGSWSGAVDFEAGDRVTSLVAADLDLDGDDDLVASSLTILAWPNTHAPQGIGFWTEGPQPASTMDTLSVALADVNHDSFPDIAAATASDGLAIWLGNGSYTWDRVAEGELPTSGQWNDVVWGQINNEAELDLAAASEGSGLGAWRGWESGTNWDDISDGLPTSGSYQAVALGHLDHDGLIDLVACGRSAGIRLWQGQGGISAPYWTHKEDIWPGEDFCDVALGHVDRNGGLDIASAHCQDGGIDVRLGDGDWSFTAATAPTTSGSYLSVALGDIDSDGDGDLVAALDGGGVTAWIGDGGSTWKPMDTIKPSRPYLSLDLGDADHDGYLDILAGYEGGVEVWLGDGGTSWTDASTNLPGTGGAYCGVAFGRIDTDALLDIAGAEVGSSGVHVWTAVEPPPGGWRNPGAGPLSDTGWVISQIASATVEVMDVGSGLDVDSAVYCLSTDGGACAGDDAWLPATCTGISGTTSYQTLTAASINFGQDSDTDNVVQFRISDTMGYAGTSPIYRLRIDTTPPTNPTDLHSTSHTEGDWSNDDSIRFDWSDAGADNVSGVDGYSFDLSTSTSGHPDQTQDRDAGPPSVPVILNATADGDWYLNFATEDHAGNWSPAAHLGPYRIDAYAPSAPSLVSSNPPTNTWSRRNQVEVQWSSSDGAGSGIDGYSYLWDGHPISVDTTIDIHSDSMTSGALIDGTWYLNIRAIDHAGNAGGVAHLGPFLVDRTDPTDCWIDAPHIANNSSFLVQWLYLDATSGVASYDVQVRDEESSSWTNWRMGTTDTSATYSGGLNRHTYYFQVSARDQAGNVSGYLCLDHTHLEVPPGLASFAPPSGFASVGQDAPPLQLVRGTTVTISGTDLTSGTVTFAGVPMEPTHSQVVNDTLIRAVVGVGTPQEAAQVCVETPTGRTCFVDTFQVRPLPYPARWGLGFENFGASRDQMTWDIFERAFGTCTVRTCATSYVFIPIPCESCPRWARVPRPSAAIFYAASKGAGAGHCFGMSYMATDFELGKVHPSDFVAGAEIPANLMCSDPPAICETPGLRAEVSARQWREWSLETMTEMASLIILWETLGGSGPMLTITAAQMALPAGDTLLIFSMAEWGSGHTLKPFEVGGRRIFVYDPNWPYALYGEDALQLSLNVSEPEWDYPGMPWHGGWPGDDFFIPVKYVVADGPRHLPSEILGLGFLGLSTREAIRVENDEGGMIGYDKTGEFTQTIPISDAVPIFPAGNDSPLMAYYFPNGGDYTAYISGTATGTYSLTVFGDGGTQFTVVDVPTAADSEDALAFAQGEGSPTGESHFTLTSTDADKPLAASLLRALGGGSEERRYNLDNLTFGNGAPLGITTDGGADSLVVSGGAGSTYDFCFDQQVGGRVPAEFCWDDVDLLAGDRHILTPEDWDQLNSTRVRLDVDHGNDGSIDETQWLVGHGLTLAMQVEPVVIRSGDLLTITLTYGVTGEEIAPGVYLTSTVPVSTTFMSAGGGVTPVGGVLTWTLGDLAPGANGQVAFTVQLDPVPEDVLVGTLAYLRDTSGRWAMASGVAAGPAWGKYKIYLPIVLRGHAP